LHRSRESGPSVFKSTFEAPYVTQMAAYYAKQAPGWLAAAPAIPYVPRVRAAIALENHILHRYTAHRLPLRRITAAVREQLVDGHVEAVVASGLTHLGEGRGGVDGGGGGGGNGNADGKKEETDETDEDVAALYTIIQDVPRGRAVLRETFAQHLSTRVERHLRVVDAATKIDLVGGMRGRIVDGSGATITGASTNTVNTTRTTYTGSLSPAPDSDVNALALVIPSLLRERARFLALARGPCLGDSALQVAVGRALEATLNRAGRSRKMARLLAEVLHTRFAETDRSTSTSSTSSTSWLSYIVEPVVLFRYLVDKDAFELRHRELLAERLLGQDNDQDDVDEITKAKAKPSALATTKANPVTTPTVIPEAERQIAAELRSVCGSTFMSRIESMFWDVTHSVDIERRLTTGTAERSGASETPLHGATTTMGNAASESSPVDPSVPLVTVRVLTQGAWPLAKSGEGADSLIIPKSTATTSNTPGDGTSTTEVISNSLQENLYECSLPAAVGVAMTKLDRKYVAAYGGRRLSVRADLGTAEVEVVGVPLRITTAQMCVLDALERDTDVGMDTNPDASTPCTIADLMARTRLARRLVVEAVRVLVAAQVVVVVTPSGTMMAPAKEVENQDGKAYMLNAAYAVRPGTVLPVSLVKAAERGEEEEADEDAAGPVSFQSYMVEAAVMRVMKQRRRMPLEHLTGEVARQLAGQGTVRDLRSAQVTSAVESLRGRDFVAYDAADANVLLYLP
jgi:hypothetical protein